MTVWDAIPIGRNAPPAPTTVYFWEADNINSPVIAPDTLSTAKFHTYTGLFTRDASGTHEDVDRVYRHDARGNIFDWWYQLQSGIDTTIHVPIPHTNWRIYFPRQVYSYWYHGDDRGSRMLYIQS